jgi:hypothetical protein
MRVGPLSRTEVIRRLNAEFVPVYVVNEDYADNGPAPAGEKAELTRIRRETLEAGMSSGTVHVFLLEPEGKVAGSLHVAEAAKTPVLLDLLDRTARRLNVQPGKPVIQPAPQSVPAKADPESLILHLTARPLSGAGSWPGVSEDWLIYTRDEAARLLPSASVRPGETWTPDPATVARLLRHFYPVTENNDVQKNRIEDAPVTAKVLSISGGLTRARVDGRLRMTHSFYHREDGKRVEASYTGYLEFDARAHRIRRFRLATETATYNGGTFGVAVRSVP